MKTPGKSKILSRTALLLLGALGACGGSASIDEAGAGKAASALSTAHQKMQADLISGSGSLKASVSGVDIAYSGTLQNAQGGSLSITGTGKVNGTNTSSNINITFNNWVDQANNITMTGMITDTSSTNTSLTDVSVSASYKGDLSLSGSVTGLVNYDLTLSVMNTCVSQIGKVGGFSINVKVGTCS